MASTTTTSTTSGPDWQELAERGLGFLEALAATVTPTPEQETAAANFVALTGALGRPARVLRVEIDKTKNTLTVVDPPEAASTYRVGGFAPGEKPDEGSFTSNTITLKNVDPTKTPVVVELYDGDKVLLARGAVR